MNIEKSPIGRTCWRVYADGKLMSTYTDKKDADNAKQNLIWHVKNQTREPFLYDRQKKVKIEVREEIYLPD